MYSELDYIISLQNTKNKSTKNIEAIHLFSEGGEKNTTCSIRIKYEGMYDSASVNCSFNNTVIWNRQPTMYTS